MQTWRFKAASFSQVKFSFPIESDKLWAWDIYHAKNKNSINCKKDVLIQEPDKNDYHCILC